MVRPLREATGDAVAAEHSPGSRGTEPAAGPGHAAPAAGPAASPGDELWHLARTTTELRVEQPGVAELAELAEATAALQDLAIKAAGESAAADRLAELAALQAGLGPGIQVMTDGPYLVTNAASVLDWLGSWDLPVYVHPGELPLAAGKYLPEYGDPIGRWLIEPLMRLMPRRAARMAAKASITEAAQAFNPEAGVPGLPDWECIPAPGHNPGHVCFFQAR